MKNLTFKLRKLLLSGVFMIAVTMNSNAQQVIADFEDLALQPDTCWYGVDSTGGYTSGELFFANQFTDWGIYTSWAGFAYSNKVDTITSGFGNQYSAYSGHAHNSSSNFGIYYNDGMSTYRMKRGSSLINDTIAGFYITNNTYAALSMKEGDAFTKKFGGTSGDDPDWFILTVYAYKNGLRKTDTVDFYLADYRFSNNAMDYIVQEWTWVDLHSLGKIDSLEFKLRSTDNGLYGMNTPAYFCFDSFYKKATGAGIGSVGSKDLNISLSPNPAVENIMVSAPVLIKTVIIYSIDGKIIETIYNINAKTFNLNLQYYISGVYYVKCINDKSEVYHTKFIKN